MLDIVISAMTQCRTRSRMCSVNSIVAATSFFLLILVTAYPVGAYETSHVDGVPESARLLLGKQDIKMSTSLSDARTAAFSSLNLIYQRYEFSTPRIQFLLVAMNVPKNAWDIIKYKTAKKFVDGKSSFRFTFGGSSVTAGHDGYFNESYPIIFERRVSSVFRHLDISLIVHNIAHGTNKCYPSDQCYEAMGGYDPDWIGWEQSFDCGRDKGIFEVMARTAYWNRAVLYLSASGGMIPNNCSPSNDTVPWIADNWTPDLEPSLKGREYAPNATAIQEFKNRTDAFFREGNSAIRFDDGNGASYPGIGSHGFSVWTASKSLCENDIKGGRGCSALDIQGGCQGQPGGNHWMTSETAMYAKGRGAGHHPPRGMHLQRGELLAYNYLHIILDAINMIEEDLKTKSAAELATVYSAELDKLQPQILPPIRHCGRECQTPPICFTDYQPNWNPSHLLTDVIISDEKKSPEGSWTRVSRGSRDESLEYKDIKIVYEASTVNATLHLKIAVTDSNYLKVCGSNMKDSMRHVHFYLDFNTTRNPYVPSTDRVLWTQRKYMADECTALLDVPKGNHTLSLVCSGRGCAFTHLVSFQ